MTKKLIQNNHLANLVKQTVDFLSQFRLQKVCKICTLDFRVTVVTVFFLIIKILHTKK